MQESLIYSEDIRINRVLHGLRPPIAIKGRPAVRGNITERMEALHVPGVSIVVIHGGQIVWAGGFGLKNAGTTDSVTTSTLFQVASISKPVAASAALQLMEAGKISLDEDVNNYLKSWKIPENSFTVKEKVTLRRILSHSAGLTVSGFVGYKSDEPIPTLRQILDGEKPSNNPAIRVDTTPGSLSRYSGGGFLILQQLLIDVTGEPFPSLLKRLVFDPVGMTLSTYEQPLPRSRLKEAASGHDGEGVVLKGKWHTYPEMAAAGLWTTPTELAEWALEISRAWTGQPSRLLPKSTAQQMLTLQQAPLGSGMAPQFGLGLALQGEGNSFSFTAAGQNRGFLARFVMYPALGKGAVVMTNADGGGTLFTEVLLSVASEYQWPSETQSEREVVNLSTEQLEGLVGTYTALTTPVPYNAPLSCEVLREGERLFVAMRFYWAFDETVHSLKVEIYPASAESFFTTGGLEILFTRNSSGRAVRVKLAGVELAATTSPSWSSVS